MCAGSEGNNSIGDRQGQGLHLNNQKQGALFHSPWGGDLIAFCKPPKGPSHTHTGHVRSWCLCAWLMYPPGWTQAPESSSPALDSRDLHSDQPGRLELESSQLTCPTSEEHDNASQWGTDGEQQLSPWGRGHFRWEERTDTKGRQHAYVCQQLAVLSQAAPTEPLPLAQSDRVSSLVAGLCWS